jgi:adenine-specific DNA methylase
MSNDVPNLFSGSEVNENALSKKGILIANSLKKILSIPSNYVGNKKRLLIHISDIVNENSLDFKRVIDPFSGSGVVSLFFNSMGYPTISNDILSSSSMAILALLKGKQVEISETDLDYVFLNVFPLLTDFCLKNYNNVYFTEKECLFLDQCKSNIVRLVGNEFCVSEFKSLSIIPSYEKEKGFRTFETNLKGTILLFLLEKAIIDICFVGGRYYNGQIMAKPEHRLAHDRNNNRDLISMLRKKIKWMFKIYEKTFLFKDSIVYNDDVNYVLDQVFLEDNNDTLVYLDAPYGGNSSDYSNLYRFSEEFLYEDKIENLHHVMNGGKKFNNKKQYNEHFCEVLSKCYKAKYILTSFNASSFNSIENICEMIKKYKKNILVKSIPIAYNYRKNRTNFECVKKISETNEEEIEMQNSEREFLILAQ